MTRRRIVPSVNTICQLAPIFSSYLYHIVYSVSEVLPEVIMTACAKCTPLQKKFTKKAFDAFKTSLPDRHAALKQKYDPRNKYYNAFEKAVAN